jgi:hypothetical protein
MGATTSQFHKNQRSKSITKAILILKSTKQTVLLNGGTVCKMNKNKNVEKPMNFKLYQEENLFSEDMMQLEKMFLES